MITRRTFMSATALSALGLSTNVLGANNRVVVGVMGIRDRGMDLAMELAKRNDVELRYFVDPDSRLFPKRVNAIEKISGQRPTCVQDFRYILDDPEVDAVVMATPDHWHALGTILACQAEKDVYVEKPTSHSIWESRKMVEAARHYKRVVQVGTQNRSAQYCKQALEYIRSTQFGDIHFMRVLNCKKRESIGREPNMTQPPKGVDYHMWLGPAPKRPFNKNHFHYNWHWFWEYSGGDIVNDAIHQIDIARWMSGQKSPKLVSAGGGKHVFTDDSETPDTQTVNWEFDNMTIAFEQTLWTPYMRKTPMDMRDTDKLPHWPFSGTRIEVFGTKEMMYFSRFGGGWQVFNAEGQSLKIQPGRFSNSNTAHMENFIDCIRTRKRPNADIEDGHLSTTLAHYGNIAYRTKQTLKIDPITEGISNHEAAKSLIKRKNYRSPWTVPKI